MHVLQVFVRPKLANRITSEQTRICERVCERVSEQVRLYEYVCGGVGVPLLPSYYLITSEQTRICQHVCERVSERVK